ncbi:MAG TPA: OpgC domain-containing protein [Bryobacteraceae bacterium]|nr:OpgC domain-containing protein [Bryobacteraceae bacterium]
MHGISQSTLQSILKPEAAGSNLLSVGVLTLTTEIQAEDFSVKPRKDFQRLPQLDTLRGFLLVWMTLTHLPTHVSQYSNQMVGYVSAAEGFILLAAILVSRIQQRLVTHEKLWRRIVRIYSYHLLLLGFAFSICAAVAARFDRVPLQNLLDFYLQHPKVALIAAPALLYNPPLLDILPMYIVFMFLTPFILGIAKRWGWGAVLIFSGSIWLLAQFNLRGWVYGAAAHCGFPIPLNEIGAFDLFGWQFLWTAGLYLGSSKAASLFSKFRIATWVVISSAAIAAVLFVCRHTAFDVLAGPTLFDVLVNKWRLGILRQIDAVAIGILLMKYGSPLAETWLGRRLATLGRASLEVFCTHLVFCFFFLGLATGTDAQYTWPQGVMIIAVTLTGLFAVAHLTQRFTQRRAYDIGLCPHPLKVRN